MKASPIRCLVSAGPTREFFDPVRFVSNPSSGKMGYAIAAAAAWRGWSVELVSGPVSIPCPEGVALTQVVTGQEMYEAIRKRFADCDILIMTAAIMDYRPKEVAVRKIKKFELAMVVEMEPVVDILKTVAQSKQDQVVVGFAAETDHLEAYATRKLVEKNADFIVANLIGGPQGAFQRDDNTVVVYSHHADPEPLGPMKKQDLGARLLDVFQPHIRTSRQVAPGSPS